ncbi:PKD domain-containing protein [bacterium SCSIO 12741]|nr:PKD domain-containing protein [bacterium SCSIO 12741]
MNTLDFSRLTLFALALLMTVASCKKEDDPEPIEPTVGIKSMETTYYTGDTIQFLNNCTDVVTYLWDFGVPDSSGDVKSSSEANPKQVYTTAGSRTVTLRGTSKDGVSRTALVGLTIKQKAPTSLAITQVVLKAKSDSVDWNTTKPDVYLKIVQLDNTTDLYTSAVVSDCAAGTDINFSINLTSPLLYPMPLNKYQMQVWQKNVGAADSMVDAFHLAEGFFTDKQPLGTNYYSIGRKLSCKMDFTLNY